MRLVLIGDGERPHLLKWARALQPRVDLWALSSRGFLPGFDACIPTAQRLALQTAPRFEGGNVALLRHLPRAAAWLRRIQPDWLHAHYLTLHPEQKKWPDPSVTHWPLRKEVPSGQTQRLSALSTKPSEHCFATSCEMTKG